MSYQALRDRVILRRVEKEAETNSPFITPEVAKTKAAECEVVGVSAGYMSDFGVWFAPPVAVGQRVLIGKYSGSEHKVDGEDLIFVRWDEVLGAEVREVEFVPQQPAPGQTMASTPVTVIDNGDMPF
jgi:chaperonin GroES